MSEAPAWADLLSLRGQTAIIAGGAGGIGQAIAHRFFEAGAQVISVDRPGCVASSSSGVEAVECDLADPAAIESLFADLQERHPRLDILVHAAGITRDAVLWKLDDDAWSDVMRVNLDSAFRMLRRAVPWMRAGEGGSVTLIASINGERGKFGQANYAASKAGLIGLARTAAREVGAFDIRVNVVAPGLIETAMTASLPSAALARGVAETALGRLGAADDVACAVLFLASQASRHVTGQVLRVDGGQLIG